MNKRMCMLGDGAWGTAVAQLLATNGHSVVIWSRDQEVADSINHRQMNDRYLPGIQLDKRITATTDSAQAIKGSPIIFIAVPAVYLRSVLEKVRSYCTPEQVWVVLSKGIEQQTLLLPTQLIADVLGYTPSTVAVSGPSFARDVAHKQRTAVTVASATTAHAQCVQQLLANAYCRPYTSQDVLGVQVGGAFKNVIALLIGMVQGAGATDNTQAFVLTRGLYEMTQLAQALGGNATTVYGLSGVGDLVLTSLGSLSKNKEFGLRMGRGEMYESIVHSLQGVVPEGINTVKSVYALQQKYALRLPIFTGVYRILFEHISLESLLDELMQHPLEQED